MRTLYAKAQFLLITFALLIAGDATGRPSSENANDDENHHHHYHQAETATTYY
jgi:hypothetical protein